jgi:hypothetical protein
MNRILFIFQDKSTIFSPYNPIILYNHITFNKVDGYWGFYKDNQFLIIGKAEDSLIMDKSLR